MTLKEFLHKIEWEGGYQEAFIYYGLTSNDVTDISESDKNLLEKLVNNFTSACVDLDEFVEDMIDKYNIHDSDEEIFG